MKKIRGTKDNMAALYDRMTQVPEFVATSDVFPDPILKFFDSLKPGTSLLDVGPGKGKEAKLALNRGLKVTGVDISPKMLEVFKCENPEAQAIVGDATKLPIEEKRFDVVFAVSSLLHLDRDSGIRALSEFYRVLKNGGLLFLLTTVGNGIEELNERPWLKKAGIEYWYFYHWEKADLLKQVKKIGFKIQSQEEEKVLENRPSGIFVIAQK